ncbi:MAG: glycosyltransferase family 4 protein, partial [Caldilineaceae bacterium]|nr:glycosyltransferase family 4 protein [Caldilineaceae bacterium]
MHVAVDAQLLHSAGASDDTTTYRSAGVSQYSLQLLQHLADQIAGQEGWRLTAFVNDRSFHAAGIDLRYSSPRLAQPLARIAWEQTLLPVELSRMDADLVHGLVNVLPLTTTLPGVVTVHDLTFLRLPSAFPTIKRLYLTQLCRASVERANAVIAVSQQTADDLIHFFRHAGGQAPCGAQRVDGTFGPATAAANADFRTRKGLPDRYALYVGTLEPRKNLVRLVRAFASWQQQANPSDRGFALVLGGAKGWFYQEIFDLVRELGLEESVRFPGYIAVEELPAWYRAAELFVYPSLFEGFGLPVLEAMASGAPVLCSRAPSLLEIVGDCAVTVPAEDH